MATKNDTNWHTNYHALKDYILEHGHLPHKQRVEFRGLLNWAKYNRRKIREGNLEAEKTSLFLDLMSLRRMDEHTGGRRKKVVE